MTKLTRPTGILPVAFLVLAMFQLQGVSAAEFETGFSRNDCSELKREIRRKWFDLQSFFRPDSKDMERPKSKDLFCVSPAYTRRAFAKASVSSDFKCYTLREQNFCCDRQNKACVGM